VTTIAILVRCLLVVLFFPFSALDKILNFDGAVGQAREMFRPRGLASLVILCGFAIEIICPLGILTGIADRLAALILAAYCAATAMLFKRFWEPGDFWQRGPSKARDLFWDFLKNLSLAGGFLLILVGLNGAGWDAFLLHPLGSTHPYSLGH
jgi:putative oxidoreductase